MPNWKYPCFECKKPVKCNQRGIQCNDCENWVHFKCTNLSEDQYHFLEINTDEPFYCLKCKPRPLYSDEIFKSSTLPSYAPNHNRCDDFPLHDDTSIISSDLEISEAHSSDFDIESVDESDSELRGLNFASLPVQNSNSTKIRVIKSKSSLKRLQTVNYKYPCNICLGPCKENSQDSIQCTLCDEWIHQKCSDLTYDQFIKYCSPENVDVPYYCEICLFGSRRSSENQSCISASAISSLDTSDILNLCPNSIFKDKEGIPTTEYFTTEELNVEIQKTPENIRLIHINAVSLCKHVDNIIAMMAEFSKLPSIIFISETRVHDDKEEFQKTQIKIPGYTFVLDNSPRNAGGTAIYVSDSLIFKERDDIIFNYPNVETCFIEIICETPGHNPILGLCTDILGFMHDPFVTT